MDAVHVGGLGGTYGGNPVACAAALAAIDVVPEPATPTGSALRIGEALLGALRAAQERHPAIGDVRGRGAMVAVELVRPGTLEPDPDAARRVAARCHRAGVVVLTCGSFGNVLRLLPPLVIGADLLDDGIGVLAEAFDLELA